jgi:hypothetical protein
MAGAPDRDVSLRELTRSGLFDANWYLQSNDDVAAAGLDPLHHFVHHGWAEGRQPNRYFDPAWYLQEDPGIGLDPLLHYMREGERMQRRPHPMFDPAWYRAAYDLPSTQSPLGHYIANRLSGQFVPCATMFAVPLIAPYRDDRAAGIDPVAHCLDDAAATGQDAFPDPAIVRASGLLDENHYLINGSDVHAARLEPSDHYCRFGWQEGRRPNIYFDPGWYLQTNPDVAHLRINPLVHYILIGEPANRRPVPFFDPCWYRNEYRVPAGQMALGHYLANRREQIYSPTPLFDVAWYLARTDGQLSPNRDPFAHYLLAGMTRDIDPNCDFDAAQYRRLHLRPPARGSSNRLNPLEHHPLVHYLDAEYSATGR